LASGDLSESLESVAGEPFCYVTTVGRRTGRPHEIEIWFGWGEGRLYLLSVGGERSDWVRNIMANPAVGVSVEQLRFDAVARIERGEEESAAGRRLLAAKYEGWRPGGRLSGWVRAALCVVIEPIG
jgi:deazaflavin-dependent oxidoreductase (nitroreductase family)